MADHNFTDCMSHVFKWEGGRVNHKDDPGGDTNYGISQRAYPNVDMNTLTKKKAEGLYRRDYWDRLSADALAPGLDLVAFDAGVNSGVSRGAKWLQRALGVTSDGKIGPVTLAAAEQKATVHTIEKACANRMGFLQGLRTWKTFGKGWGNRVADTEAVSVGMLTRNSRAVRARALSAAKTGKQQTEGAAATVVGSGTTLAVDVPSWIGYGVIAVGALVLVGLVLKIRHNRRREIAFERVAKEMDS